MKAHTYCGVFKHSIKTIITLETYLKIKSD